MNKDIKIIIDGYKNADKIIENNKADIIDEIKSHMHDMNIKRLIITPWHIWNAEEIYNKKGDVIILVNNHEGYNTKEKIVKVNYSDILKINNSITYTYYMRLRPPSIGTQPKGTISINTNRLFIDYEDCYYEFWGSVTYDRPLTDAEVYDYDLEYLGNVEAERIKIIV